jgi:hypothetical protein
MKRERQMATKKTTSTKKTAKATSAKTKAATPKALAILDRFERRAARRNDTRPAILPVDLGRRTAKSGDWPVFRLKEVRYAGNRWPKTRACPPLLRLCISPGPWEGDSPIFADPWRKSAPAHGPG